MSDDNKSIYDELDNLNLDNLYASGESKKNGKGGEAKKEDDPKDCIYEKTYTCSVCGNTFKEKAIRKGKCKFVKNELDLKPLYTPIQPDYYDIILCRKCGHAALSSKFNKTTYNQEQAILNTITPKFYPKEYPDVYTVDIAIERYKLALYNCMVKKTKAGEKAFICLKLAWFYRDKKDAKNEVIYLNSAYNGFNEAFIHETMPICGMDENTLLYIIAAIGARTGKLDDSLKILGRLIVNKNLNTRLKDKITELRDLLRKIKEKSSAKK